MSSIAVASIAFACIAGGALFGSFLRSALPERHLKEDSRDAVKMGIGIIATLAALVLGLLVASAKSSLDAVNQGLTEMGAKIIVFDRILANYGPEANDIRSLAKQNVARTVERVWPEDARSSTKLEEIESATGLEEVQLKLRQLKPTDDIQRQLQSQAIEISGDLAQSRWLLLERAQNSLPTPFLVVVVFWFAVLFGSSCLLTPPNATVLVVMFVCTLSVAGALFLLLEMNHPLEGMIKASSAPLLKALQHLGR